MCLGPNTSRSMSAKQIEPLSGCIVTRLALLFTRWKRVTVSGYVDLNQSVQLSRIANLCEKEHQILTSPRCSDADGEDALAMRLYLD